nr:8785_t:CDS:2 [Entrophospora candida]
MNLIEQNIFETIQHENDDSDDESGYYIANITRRPQELTNELDETNVEDSHNLEVEDNNYIHQNSGGDNFDHQNSQNVGNNYINQNFGEILQSNDDFNQNSSHNDIIYRNTITATNINHPNNPFGIREGSYQNDYFQNSINSIITIDQNNNEQLLVHIELQLRNIQNAINQISQLLNSSRNNNR